MIISINYNLDFIIRYTNKYHSRLNSKSQDKSNNGLYFGQ